MMILSLPIHEHGISLNLVLLLCLSRVSQFSSYRSGIYFVILLPISFSHTHVSGIVFLSPNSNCSLLPSKKALASYLLLGSWG